MKHHVNKAAKHWYVGVILVLAAAVGWMALGKGTIQQGCVVSEGANVTMDVVFGIGDNNGITIIDTTKEDVATKAGIYSPFKKYQPISIIIGNSTYLKAFEENIIGMRRGEEKTFVIPPENAYGYYNSSKRMIVALNLFNRQPVIGETVTIANMTGRVVSMNSTAALIDFNNPLAGKSLVYRVWIRDVKCAK